MKITPDLFRAYLECPTKCWLRAAGEGATGNTYAEWVKTQDESFRAEETARLVGNSSNVAVAKSPEVEHLQSAKWQLATNISLLTQMNSCAVVSCLHAIERMPSEGRGKAAQFVPLRFIFRNKLTKDDKRLLAFDAFVLSQVLGREIRLGKVIHGDDHAALKVKASALAGEVRKRLDKITALLASPAPPDLVLNRHCAECEFRDRCRKIAVEKDDLSLLAGMSAKERQKLRSKGIFTVTQLSYTFRPRRRPKRLRDKREKYHHSLKALAIREKKIHIVGSPELKIEGTPVYLDVEGLPDRDFYYLIGLRIGHGESAVQHSLWADTVADEGKIWREFLALLETVEKPVLIHYGSYETDFIERMNSRYGAPPETSVAAKAIGSPINLLSVIYGQFYFPTHTNGLKELATWLGFKWACPGVAGIQTVGWRNEWDKSATPKIRQDIANYNADDCAALETVARVVCALSQQASPARPDLSNKCVRVDQLKPLPRFNLINKDGAALPEFKLINRAAYWDYQRIRVYVRTSKVIRKACRRKRARGKATLVKRVITHRTPTSCPICRATDLGGEKVCVLVHDVKIISSGAKAWITEQSFYRCRCRQCGSLVKSPTPHAFSLRKFGPTLRAYAVNQLIDLKIPGMTVAKSLSQLFRLELTGSIISQFKSDFAGLYTETIKKIVDRITKGSLVHADETKASIVGKSAVVWVLTSLEDVAFMYSESREGEMVQALLTDFTGVLVSDFYAVYDAFNCPQQKCLIHLMRDINDDLLKYPFDPELRDIAHEFAGVLKPIVETIDKRGLKAHFLAKHKASADRFLRWVAEHEFDSEIGQAYGKRFRKNRERLFTFLAYDGVPWNNNNAENAIRAFASIRKTVGGVWTEKGLREYLVLLSISETCKRRGLNFFEFLCSGETDLEGFVANRGLRRSARSIGSRDGREIPYNQQDQGDVKPGPPDERDALQVRATPFMPTETPSPWDRFRTAGATDATPTIKRDLNLERFNKVPFGAGMLAIPALAVGGFWEQASDLFPAWIERTFAEIALFRLASLVMSQPVNLEQIEPAWPTAWDHLLARTQLPDNRSLMDLMNLIGQNSVGLGTWQGTLTTNWLCNIFRAKAVLLIDSEHRLLLEAPAVSSVDERARNSLFTRCSADLWYRILDGAPMLLLTQPATEANALPWKEWILPQLRDVWRGQARERAKHTASESHPLTVVFTNGGVHLPLFRRLHRNGLHVLSYRLSMSGLCSDERFTEKEVELEARHRELMHVAERELSFPGGLTLTEVVCVHREGPKLTVISSNCELDLERIAARLAFEFTASRFLHRLGNSLAWLGSYGTQHSAGSSLQSNASSGCESFLRAVALPAFRAETMMEQILREKAAPAMESPLVLRDVLCKQIDLLPAPRANLLNVLVHINNHTSEQTAVSHLCALLTATETRFPGTNLKLVYKPELASPR